MKMITSVITALCIALLLCACNQKGTDGSDVQDRLLYLRKPTAMNSPFKAGWVRVCL